MPHTDRFDILSFDTTVGEQISHRCLMMHARLLLFRRKTSALFFGLAPGSRAPVFAPLSLRSPLPCAFVFLHVGGETRSIAPIDFCAGRNSHASAEEPGTVPEDEELALGVLFFYYYFSLRVLRCIHLLLSLSTICKGKFKKVWMATHASI